MGDGYAGTAAQLTELRHFLAQQRSRSQAAEEDSSDLAQKLAFAEDCARGASKESEGLRNLLAKHQMAAQVAEQAVAQLADQVAHEDERLRTAASDAANLRACLERMAAERELRSPGARHHFGPMGGAGTPPHSPGPQGVAPKGPELGSQNLYKVLGVSPTETAANITKAFRKLARQHHPDKRKDKDDDATFKVIKEAHEVLTDAKRRELYNQTGFKTEEDMVAGVGRDEGHPGAGGFNTHLPQHPHMFPGGGMMSGGGGHDPMFGGAPHHFGQSFGGAPHHFGQSFGAAPPHFTEQSPFGYSDSLASEPTQHSPGTQPRYNAQSGHYNDSSARGAGLSVGTEGLYSERSTASAYTRASPGYEQHTPTSPGNFAMKHPVSMRHGY